MAEPGSGDSDVDSDAEAVAAKALSRLLSARNADPRVTPGRYAPNEPEARAEYWQALQGLDLFADSLGSDFVGEAVRSVGVRDPVDPCPSSLGETMSTDGTDAAPSDTELANVTIEGYRVLREIYAGGQATVYKAVQLSTHRMVALKILHGGVFASQRHLLRFEREIDLVASLNHPNIVRIYDSGLALGQPYFAMEFIRGKPLDRYVRDKKGDVRSVLELFRSVCAAVSFAHQRGVIHRDLKPGNILVDHAGEPHILDFGLAKVAGLNCPGEDAPLTLTQEFIGTLAYASPEQASGDPSAVDVRSDVYSLGVILYELLTGQFPYPIVGKLADVLQVISKTPPLPPGSRFPRPRSGWRSRHRRTGGIDDEIETIVIKTLAKEKGRRYQSAGDLQRDIDNYLHGEAIEAKRDSAWYVLRKMAARHALAAVMLGALFMALVGFGGVSFYFWQEARGALAATRTRDALVARQNSRISALQSEVPGQVRRMALGYLLLAWHEGRLTRARAILDEMPTDSPERRVGDYLLDDAVSNEELLAILVPRQTALAYFAIAERLRHAGRFDEAASAFRTSIASGADDWLAAYGESQLQRIAALTGDRED